MILEPPRDLVWSRERWFLTITIMFAVQIVVIIWLSSREDVPVRADAQRLKTQFFPVELSQSFEPLLRVMDPSVFVQASPEGFSGNVWLKVRPIDHRSPGWTDKPQFLKFDEEQLLVDLYEFGSVNPPRRRPVDVDIIGNLSARGGLGDSLKPMPVSTIQISGQLSNSDLIEGAKLPVVEFSGVLAPTRLELMVDQRGRVFSTVLLNKSGSTDADEMAMKTARSLMFGLAEGFSPATDKRDFQRMRRATLTAHWWTVPEAVVPPVAKPATNTPPPKVEALP